MVKSRRSERRGSSVAIVVGIAIGWFPVQSKDFSHLQSIRTGSGPHPAPDEDWHFFWGRRATETWIYLLQVPRTRSFISTPRAGEHVGREGCLSESGVDCVWNVMAHAHKPDFVFRRNRRVHLIRRGHQFSRLLAAELCGSAVVMLDTPCSEVVWRVLATHSIRQFPLHFPSRVYRVPSRFNWNLLLLLGPTRHF